MQKKIVRMAAASFLAIFLTYSATIAAAEETPIETSLIEKATAISDAKTDDNEADEKEKERKEHVGRLPVNAFLLAGVAPGIREEEIRQVCGKPLYGDCEIMVFANGLVAEFDDEHPGIVEELVVAKPGTSAKTPAGLTPGMSESEIEKHYGKSDKKTENPLYTVYTYYSLDGTLKMKFTVKDGVILKIKCDPA